MLALFGCAAEPPKATLVPAAAKAAAAAAGSVAGAGAAAIVNGAVTTAGQAGEELGRKALERK